MNFDFILEIKKEFYILSNEEGTFFYEGLIFNINKRLEKIINEKIKVGMALNSKYALFIYNENHRNILSFLDSKKKIGLSKKLMNVLSFPKIMLN